MSVVMASARSAAILLNVVHNTWRPYGQRALAAASRSAAAPQRLVASRQTDSGKLAGAICAQLRSFDAVTVAAMGPSAINKALRSAVVAGEFLGPERPGEEIAVVASQEAVGADESEVEMRLSIRSLPLSAGAGIASGEVDIMVAQATNVGKVASYAARLIDEGAGIPVLRGMGPQAVSQALKATTIMRGFLKLNDGEELVVTPRILKTLSERKDKSGSAPEKKVEYVLVCRRWTVPKGQQQGAD